MTAIATISQGYKAARGTKRVCQACGVRFYDLTRDPIVCPACATEYMVVSSAEAGPQVGVIAPSNKTSWRSRTVKQVKPALPERAPEVTVPDAPPEDAPQEEPITDGAEDLVLEHDAEDGDYSEAEDIDTAVIEPEER